MSSKEIKHCQIDRVEGEPSLPHHFCVYIDGKLMAGDVPVQMLAAAPQMVEAIKYALQCEKEREVLSQDPESPRRSNPLPTLIEMLEEALELAGVEVDHE